MAITVEDLLDLVLPPSGKVRPLRYRCECPNGCETLTPVNSTYRRCPRCNERDCTFRVVVRGYWVCREVREYHLVINRRTF